jgi:HSP20 family molecular chaperone IbpA
MVPAAAGQAMARVTRPSVQGNIDRMFQDFRNSFDDMMTPFFTPGSLLALPTAPLALIEGALPIRFPVIDVIDDGDNYKVRAELPGFSKENVEVNVGEDALELRAEVGADNQQKTRGNGRYLSRESAYSAFQRNIQFPEHVAPSKVEGTMKDGVLQLTIPKKEPTSAKMTRVPLK